MRPNPNPNPDQNVILDSESFDVMVHEIGDAEREAIGLYFLTFKRLKDYWMTRDEIKHMLGQALDFTREAAADPQHAALDKIPIVVGIEVCTVQQDGESVEAAMGRAIRAQYLVPLYLWTKETPKQYKLREYGVRWLYFLRKLGKIRVENVDEGLALMPACHICSRATTTGAQITVLPSCGHAFHTRCVWVWLENNEKCPLCGDSVV
ncbi:Putative RING-H2 finger protein ATL50 [Striga hermonthica]|uniref:RING-H2 finger protein ATL50 n=1 Tax=Striga hermonthica TaxID=68872 RepID=A0A9N7NBU4_STRHE|nr:Putative RING-H2 finger protein ATL50 [Striga hermonthica]